VRRSQNPGANRSRLPALTAEIQSTYPLATYAVVVG